MLSLAHHLQGKRCCGLIVVIQLYSNINSNNLCRVFAKKRKGPPSKIPESRSNPMILAWPTTVVVTADISWIISACTILYISAMRLVPKRMAEAVIELFDIKDVTRGSCIPTALNQQVGIIDIYKPLLCRTLTEFAALQQCFQAYAHMASSDAVPNTEAKHNVNLGFQLLGRYINRSSLHLLTEALPRAVSSHRPLYVMHVRMSSFSIKAYLLVQKSWQDGEERNWRGIKC